MIGDVAGGEKWLGCYDNQKRATPHPPTNLNQVYNLCRHTNPKPPPSAWPLPAARLITSENVFWFLGGFFTKKKNKRSPNRNPHLLLQNWTTVKYTVQLLPIHYTHQIFISTLNPLPDEPIVLERQAWPPLLLALPFSSWFFDSEEESDWRSSRSAVEGESAISPSLPVLNSLMKFRSEEQWHKHSHTVVAIFTCLSLCGGQSEHLFVCFPA